MTDTFAALVALKDGATPERDALFARFEERWRDEPLVLDKWFALEAQAERSDTLTRVQSLLAHPRFNARNPNRVRSLVGAFALRNFARFHAADGRGYAFAPTRCWRSTPPIRSSPPPSRAHSTCGSALRSRGAD